MSTGFSAIERAGVRIGDAVAIFAQGPIGLCAAPSAKLSGAALVIAVDAVPARLEVAKRLGADVVLDPTQQDVVAEIKRRTGGGADLTVEAPDRRRGRHRGRSAGPTGHLTHRFRLDQIEEAYDLFGHQRDGVLKVAIAP
jgi:threonine dehydrogenase-like Zn-dependent dehydrogenase